MSSINTMRAILVAGAVFAALLAALYGEWLVVAVLMVGVIAHGLMWWYLYRVRVGSPDG